MLGHDIMTENHDSHPSLAVTSPTPEPQRSATWQPALEGLRMSTSKQDLLETHLERPTMPLPRDIKATVNRPPDNLGLISKAPLEHGNFMVIRKRHTFCLLETYHNILLLLCPCSSCVRLFVTPGAVACQVPLSTGFPRQEYWSGLPFPSLGNLPDPGIEPVSLASLALHKDSLPLGHLCFCSN